MKIYFCTFGDEPRYSHSINLLLNEARSSGYFDHVTSYNQNTIPATDKEKIFMSTNSRGYGYWFWKSIIILDMLSKIEYGDIVFYADAGCGISTTPAAREKFKEWVNSVLTHETHRFSLQMTFPAEEWSKADIFKHLDCDDDSYKKSGQHIGGIQCYMKTDENIEFVKKYKEYMEADNFHYITDAPSYIPNPACFKDHRHDQAILSLLFKKYGSANFPDHWKDPNFPIMALRRK